MITGHSLLPDSYIHMKPIVQNVLAFQDILWENKLLPVMLFSFCHMTESLIYG